MNEAIILRVIAQHRDRAGPLLPILHDLQQELGYVPAAAVPLIADALNLSRAEVHGVSSFYHDFRSTPAERPVVKLCRAEACQARGADPVAAALTDLDTILLEPVYCLGLCASGPCVMIDDHVYGRLDAEAAVRLATSVAG